MTNLDVLIVCLYLDGGIPGGGVQLVAVPTHLTDGVIVTHQRVLPPAVRDGVKVPGGRGVAVSIN